MNPIRPLEPVLVDQIAAGEVVERPGSVVKELVENALDAGAGRIEVSLQEGGRRRIEVRDDGAGIPAAELELAVTAHATSKIRTAADLHSIASLGFRGEALASIAAVSRLELISRPAGAAAAAVRVHFGRMQPVRAAGGPPGTRIVVEDLFGELPARLKFLKQTSTELAHAAAWVERLCLSHLGVGFHAEHDGHLLLDVAPQDDLETRCGAVFGAAFARRMLPIAERHESLALEARIGPPDSGRRDASRVHLYLNGRWVRDPRLLRAVREGTREFLPDALYPALVLFLAVPPERVDVNVHPQKLEVRFRDERFVFGAVVGALRRGLAAAPWAARRVGGVGEAAAPQRSAPYPTPPAGNFTLRERGAAPALRLEPPAAQPRAAPSAGAGAFAVGQFLSVANTFLVREVPDGLEILDQHALHERVNLEDLRRQLRAGGVLAQPLLVPALVDAGREEMEALLRHAELLRSLGVEIEALGPGSLAVRTVPAALSRLVPERLLADLLELVAEQREASADALMDEVLHRMACRGAVMAGDRLDADMLHDLLRRGGALPQDRTCAHGRPVRVHLSLGDLERAFHRR
ncbi:MAG: DNA mismatch repair endonuclease MutL [Planctomycetota bacterium]|nr:MAG: DNA mismatch repair endonuclease MutL [Planctomycetota bacterium]